MLRLALVAVLLMALAPSVSRLLASAGTQVLDGWTELCTTSGVKWVDTGRASPAEKSFPGMGHAGEDCSYCRLVDLLPLVLLFVCIILPRLLGGHILFPAAPRLRVLQNQRGLGGQGPPIFL